MDIEITIWKVIYFSSMDEDSFFKRLESISAVKNVNGNSGGLGILIKTPISKDDLYELTSLFKRYNVSLSYLNVLLKNYNHDLKWYYDRKVFYKGLFKKMKIKKIKIRGTHT